MTKNWSIKKLKEIKFKSPLMIEGLPGMGNVGKIAVDFMIESLNAEKIFEISSSDFPSCVFVNESGIAELPKVEIYFKKHKNNDLFIISGDVQPPENKGCYEFCENLLNLFVQCGGKQIITLGGIGLEEMPRKPSVYCTGTDKKEINDCRKYGAKSAVGVVGPIIGVSGLLIGLAKERKMKGTSLLVETYGHPTYLGIKEARELLKILNLKLNIGINIKLLDKEVKEIEKEIKDKLEKIVSLQDDKFTSPNEHMNYIG